MSRVDTRRAAVTGGRVVTPDGVLEGGVRIEGDRIAAVGDVETGDTGTVVDARGRYVLPGLVDLHGDDIESHLFPRSGARVSTEMALASADRSNAAAGITTKFHAVSFERDEESDRSPELGADLSAAITGTDDLVVDHRLHARCEVTQEACVAAVLDIVDRGQADLVSVMSHVPGKGQFRDTEAFLEYYRESTDHSVEKARQRLERRGEVSMATLRERVDRVLRAAHEAGVVTASHDDEDPAEVERLSGAGVDISEYPITLETARRAQAVGMVTAMGAPNLVRGESQWGNLRTETAIEAGAVDALVADYHPMSLLGAVFVDTGESLPRRVARATAAPAAAAGLVDRGRIESGARADLIVVDPSPTPTVTRAFVAGRPVYRAEGSP
ncbi:MAG: alpha-D-ribose 1-methylphosphonate 5-triphosphate diphosphatase [Salinirussus sp.]